MSLSLQKHLLVISGNITLYSSSPACTMNPSLNAYTREKQENTEMDISQMIRRNVELWGIEIQRSSDPEKYQSGKRLSRHIHLGRFKKKLDWEITTKTLYKVFFLF